MSDTGRSVGSQTQGLDNDVMRVQLLQIQIVAKESKNSRLTIS